MLTIRRMEETIEQLLNEKYMKMVSFPDSALSDEAAELLNAKSPDEVKRVTRETELILQSSDDIFLSKGKVYPKQVFFRSTRFRIRISQVEAEEKILIPGVSFIVFSNQELFSSEFQLHDENGTPFSIVSRSILFSRTAPAFYLLGHSGIIDYLSAEAEENRQMMKGSADVNLLTVRLSVFDCSEFFKKNDLRAGDYLVVSVDDWQKGIFTVRAEKQNDVTDELQRAYLRDFEQALVQVCEDESDYIDIPGQISEAYFKAFENNRDLRNRPYLPLEEYRLFMSEIAIKRDGPEWILTPVDNLDTPGDFEQVMEHARRTVANQNEHTDCQCGHEHGEHGDCQCGHDHEHNPQVTLDPDLSPDRFSVSSGTINSTDDILTELNAPVNSIELTAMIFEAFSNGEESFENFKSGLMDWLNLNFADDAQEAAFINFLEDDWEIAAEYYSPEEDSNRAQLRSRLLDLTRIRIDTAVRILERYKGKDVPKNLADSMTQIHRKILETLSVLNADIREDEDAYSQLELRVDDIEEEWDDFVSRFQLL